MLSENAIEKQDTGLTWHTSHSLVTQNLKEQVEKFYKHTNTHTHTEI